MRRFARNILFVFSGDVSSRLLGLFATIWLARTLGVYGFGRISFAFTFLGYSLLLMDPGLSILGTREVARNPALSKGYVYRISYLRVLLATVAFILIATLSLLVPGMSNTKGLIILYCISLFPYALSVDWFFRGRERMKHIAVSPIIAYSLYLALVLIFVRSQDYINLVPLFWFFGVSISSLYLWIRMKGENNIKNPQKQEGIWKILKTSLPIGIGTMMTSIYFNFDITMLGFMRGAREAGLYNATYKLLMFLLLVDRVFSMVILPLFSRHYKKSRKSFEHVLSMASRAIIAVVLPLSAGGFMLALPIMGFVYGGEYTNSFTTFRLLIWALVITGVGSIYTQGLIASGNEKKYASAMIMGTLANVVLNLIMIPKFGMVGAAVATLFSEVVMVFFMFFAFSKIARVHIIPHIARPIFASVVMCISLYLMRELNLSLLILIGAVIYISLIYATGGITREDMRFILGEKRYENME